MSQILNLAHNKAEIERRVHAVIDKFAERGLRSLAVAYQVISDQLLKFLGIYLCKLIQDSRLEVFGLLQEVPEGTKESAGGPWQFMGLMPLFDPPRHDSAETIRRALNLGVNVKMITGEFFVLLTFDSSSMMLFCLSSSPNPFLFS